MDITDEVRFRVSPDIQPAPVRRTFHTKSALKSNKKDPRENKNVSETRSSAQRTPKLAPRLQAVMNKDGLIELDLSSKHLREIPKPVYDLSRIEVLNVADNNIRVLSSSVCKLHRLKFLNARKNLIICLPETFTNLKHLKEIDFSDNHLQSLPSQFGVLKDLRILRLANNKFENLPHNLGDITGLKVLELPGNKIWHLPSTFQNLTKLQRLSLAENKFDQLPVSICRLKNLEALDLHSNQLINLPSDLSNLVKLQELNLASNKLQFVPTSVLHLKKLHSLDISENLLVKLPDRMNNLTRLRVLNVSANKLNSFPNSALSNLEYLNVSRNCIRNFSVVQLKKLKYLSANANKLENIPLGVYNLSKLEVLKLSNNGIGYLSQDVILLQELKQLDLSNNRLRILPQVINDLEKLETFNVKGNQLEERTVIEHGFPFEGKRTKSWQQDGGFKMVDSPLQMYGTFRSEPNMNMAGLKPEPMLLYPQNQLLVPAAFSNMHYGQPLQYYGSPNGEPITQPHAQHNMYEYNPFLTTNSNGTTSTSKKKKSFWSRIKKDKLSTSTPHSTTALRNAKLRNSKSMGYGSTDALASAPVFYTAPRPKRESTRRMIGSSTKDDTPTATMPTARQRTIRGHSHRQKERHNHHGNSNMRSAHSLSDIDASLSMLRIHSNNTPQRDSSTSRYTRNGDGPTSSRRHQNRRKHSPSPGRSHNNNSDYSARYAKYNDFAPVRSKSYDDITHGGGVPVNDHEDLCIPPQPPKEFFKKHSSMGTVRSLSSLSSLSSDSVPPVSKSSWFAKQQRKRLPRSWGSSKATVDGSETIGDALSLGEDDHLYQPTSVRDQRLVGVVSDVESLLNDQLLEPVNKDQQRQGKLFKPRVNLFGTVKTLRGLSSKYKDTASDTNGYHTNGTHSNGHNNHHGNHNGYHDNDYDGSYYNTGFLSGPAPNIGIYDTLRSVSSVQSDNVTYGGARTSRFSTSRRHRSRSRSPRHHHHGNGDRASRDGLVAQKNDIMLKRPDEVKEVRNEHYHRKEERFRVTTSGGIFRSSLDHNISVYFPMGAVDFPLTVTMQVERVTQAQLEEAKSLQPSLSNLHAVSSILHLKQNFNVEFLTQVMVTMPAPSVDTGGHMHVLSLGRYGDFTPCNATVRRSHGYLTLNVRTLSGKVIVMTKSKDKYKACASMDEFMNVRSS